MTHERALMDDLMRKIDSVARDEGAARVVAVTVRLGPLSHFTPDHFREHFEWAAEGTVAAGAEVRFEQWGSNADADDAGVVLAGIEIPSA